MPAVPFLSHRTVFVTEPGGGERVVITLSGELDMVSGAMVTEVVEMCLRSRPTGVRVDISDLTLMDCGGLGQLHRAARAARLAGAGFTLTGSPQPMVGRVLQLTGTPLGALPAPREDTPSRPAAAPGRWARLLRLSVLTASATTILLAVAETA
ncbi:STAS domain-containing protein [Streptomyces sp. CAU 1734]|uniref:STAS domain-containing protein n=1 Tax=Streptomyces sp. CAU 1734 TaxID=3140360 RepID=UPI003261246F